MNSLRKALRGSSRGDTKWFVIIAIAVVAVGIYVAAFYGPIYTKKWDLEDRMHYVIMRLNQTGEDGMWDDLQGWAELKKIPLKVYDQCVFTGEIGKLGRMTCDYTVTLHMFGGRYTRVVKVHAATKVPMIPYEND